MTRKWLALVSMAGAYALVYLDQMVLNVALPTISRKLSTTSSELEWVVNGYLLALAIFVFAGGKLADLCHLKKLYTVGILIFLVGTLLCGLAPTVTFLIGARFLQGIGGALMLPPSQALIYHNFEKNERGKALGIYAAVGVFCLVIGPFIGGVITEFLGWRYIFYLNIPFGICFLWLSHKFIADRPPSTSHSFDILGQVLLFLGMIGLLSHNMWMTLVGIAFLFYLLIHEWRTKYPLINIRLFRKRNVSAASTTFFILQMAWLASVFFAIHLQDNLHYSPAIAGLLLLPASVGSLFLNPIFGKLTDRYGSKIFIVAGMFFSAILFTYLLFFNLTYPPFLVGLLAFSVAMPMIFAPVMHLLMHSVPETQVGMAAGLGFGLRQVGGTVGFALMGIAFGMYHFKGVMGLLAIACLLCAIMALIAIAPKEETA